MKEMPLLYSQKIILSSTFTFVSFNFTSVLKSLNRVNGTSQYLMICDKKNLLDWLLWDSLIKDGFFCINQHVNDLKLKLDHKELCIRINAVKDITMEQTVVHVNFQCLNQTTALITACTVVYCNRQFFFTNPHNLVVNHDTHMLPLATRQKNNAWLHHTSYGKKAFNSCKSVGQHPRIWSKGA